jgi:hypothetical protein
MELRARKKEKCDELYAIRPAMSGGQQGWLVSLHRGGIAHNKSFTVFKYGSTEAALDAAKGWRDEMARTLPALTKAEYSNLPRRNNSTGFAGVYLMKTTRRCKDGREVVHIAWEARTPLGAKPSRKKSFSVKKFGHERAYELAVAARKSFVAELEGYLLRRVPDHLKPLW